MCVILVSIIMVGKIPFVNNMSNRSHELLFVSIISRSMFWSVAIIALMLLFIMLFVSLLYQSTEMVSLVFGIGYTSPTKRLCFSISITHILLLFLFQCHLGAGMLGLMHMADTSGIS